MSFRSSVIRLVPFVTRQELEKRVIENGFSNFDDLTQWLHDLGYPVSRSAVYRYARKIEQRERDAAEAAGQVRAFAVTAAADPNAAAHTLFKLVEHRLFNALLDTDRHLSVPELRRLTRDISKLYRTLLLQRRAEAKTLNDPE